MATIAVTKSVPESLQHTCAIAAWSAITTTDNVGEAIEFANFPDRSIQVEGNFGTGGSLRIEGSNDGTNWHALNDPYGVALDFSAAGLRGVTELVRFIRPRLTAGTGAVSLTVTALLKHAL